MKRQWLVLLGLVAMIFATAACVPVTKPSSPLDNQPATAASSLAPILDSHLHYYDFTHQTDGFPALVKAMDAAGVGHWANMCRPSANMICSCATLARRLPAR